MKKTSKLVLCGIIAAIYATLTLALPVIGFGVIQFRLAEAMCVLPFFIPVSAIGLTVGCLISNSIGVAMGMTTVLDIVFGTLATAIASFITIKIRRKAFVPLPAVVSNAVIIGAMLTYVMSNSIFHPTLLWNMGAIAISQALSCYCLGLPLMSLIERIKLPESFKELKKK